MSGERDKRKGLLSVVKRHEEDNKQAEEEAVRSPAYETQQPPAPASAAPTTPVYLAAPAHVPQPAATYTPTVNAPVVSSFQAKPQTEFERHTYHGIGKDIKEMKYWALQDDRKQSECMQHALKLWLEWRRSIARQGQSQ